MVLAKSRAKVSSVPPGATPTIIVIDFDGKLCANAEFENISAATTQNNVRIMICLRMICLLLKTQLCIRMMLCHQKLSLASEELFVQQSQLKQAKRALTQSKRSKVLESDKA
jgi:hypothetical protein